eukprot:5945563-Pyramimonas_sp.AAC.1
MEALRGMDAPVVVVQVRLPSVTFSAPGHTHTALRFCHTGAGIWTRSVTLSSHLRRRPGAQQRYAF